MNIVHPSREDSIQILTELFNGFSVYPDKLRDINPKYVTISNIHIFHNT